jgi:hypothetical protein
MSESMPGWGEFQSALSQLQSVSGGGGGGSGGGGGATGGGAAGAAAAGLPTRWVDPVDEAYMIPDIQAHGGQVLPSGSINWGDKLPTRRVDPVDEAYMIPDIQRGGGSVGAGGNITWRTPAGTVMPG